MEISWGVQMENGEVVISSNAEIDSKRKPKKPETVSLSGQQKVGDERLVEAQKVKKAS